MTVSVHDNLITAYEVRCDKRKITLRTEFSAEGKPAEFTNIVFDEVEAYHFQNDAFGNIIFSVDELPLEKFLQEYGTEMLGLRRFVGRLDWTEDLISAPERMRRAGIKSYLLHASYGLSGWVLAKRMEIVAAAPS